MPNPFVVAIPHPRGILLVAGTGVVVVKNTYFPNEPSYQGRKLSEWLVDIDYGQPQNKRAKAGEAIRQMGVQMWHVEAPQ